MIQQSLQNALYEINSKRVMNSLTNSKHFSQQAEHVVKQIDAYENMIFIQILCQSNNVMGSSITNRIHTTQR